jgi:hydrocephalus-inducing protein
VRTRATQSVVLKNPTNTAWVLHPSFDHQFWSGAASIEVPPRQQVPYELVYTPLTTAEHRATLFVPLPNGQASVFRLVGTAAPPSPESQLQRQVLCKQTVVETLRVRNWLSQAQHFAVQIEPASSPLVQISGVDTLDVPPQGERAYKLTFKALKPGTTKVAIKFVAQGSNEYVHHLVEFIAGAPLVEELPFVLSTALRQKVVKHVRIVNPFPDRAATVSGFMCEPECREVFVPTPLQVSAGSEVLVPVSFRPLIADGGKERTVTLTLSSEELGAFCYRVRLQVVQEDAAAPAASASPVAAAFAADKTLRFDTSLGCELTQTVRFQSLATVPAKYDFKLPAGSPFSLVGPASVQAPAAAADSDGVEVAVQVRYDPVAVGDSREVLLATSPIGGDFRILLIGSCSAPKPLGPVAVASSAGATIQFRNPSDAPQDFTFSVDNAAFTLTKKSEKIAPKKVATIAVSFKGAGDETGKLLIAGCGTQWVFYLRGAK